MQKAFEIGIMFRCQNPPEELITFVQRAEENGFDEVWVVEDCFFGGGIASASIALAVTKHIQVGLGIIPAVVRNSAFSAMEIATLSRIYPNRFLPGLGHGVSEWMKQVDAFPASQLKAIEEVTTSVRALLAGELLDFHGDYVNLSQVQLEFPPATVPPIALGVRGPKSLRLSGRVADGTILAEYASPAYVSWAIEQIKAGQRDSGRENDPHRITVYAYCSMDSNRELALQKLRPRVASAIASGNLSTYLEPLGILDQAKQLIAEKGASGLEHHIPDEWISQLAIVGTATECRDAITKLADAGADSIVLVPIEDDLQTLTSISESLLPLLPDRA